jgi:hypothetical protein
VCVLPTLLGGLGLIQVPGQSATSAASRFFVAALMGRSRYLSGVAASGIRFRQGT